MRLPDAQQMREIDARAESLYAMRSIQLMENAGSALARAVLKELADLPGSTDRQVLIIAGKGNNGGDGFVAARHLKNAGVDVTIQLAAKIRDMRGDAAINADIWMRSGGRVTHLRSGRDIARARAATHAHVVIDALFGTGLKEPIKGFHAKVVEYINSLSGRIVSVDIPSGIDATTGAILGCTVRAHKTVTMALPKLGMYLYPGRDFCGEIEIADIGVPLPLLDDESVKTGLTVDADIKRILKPRKADTHKGSFGHVLVVAGSVGKAGAAFMAGMGALRAGAGLVTLAIPECIAASIEKRSVELMTLRLPQSADKTIGIASCDVIKGVLEGKAALVIGPGLGRGGDVSAAIVKILELSGRANIPVVIDADAVVMLKGNIGILKAQRVKAIMTPHPGEMAMLTGGTIANIQSDRINAARGAAKGSGAVILLKGASTVIAAPDGRVMINPTGNANLATAGTGDVLAGIIGGFVSQKIDLFDAALAGAFIHGKAADGIKKRTGSAGMIATDLLPVIPLELGYYSR